MNQNCNRDRTREFGPQDCSNTNSFESFISPIMDQLCFCVPTTDLNPCVSHYSYLPYVLNSYLSVCLLLGDFKFLESKNLIFFCIFYMSSYFIYFHICRIKYSIKRNVCGLFFFEVMTINYSHFQSNSIILQLRKLKSQGLNDCLEPLPSSIFVFPINY